MLASALTPVTRLPRLARLAARLRPRRSLARLLVGRGDGRLAVRGHEPPLRLRLRAGDADLYEALLVLSGFEYDLSAVGLGPQPTVWDAGAHVGLFTLHALGELGASARVAAFEPDGDNFALLGEHLELNGAASRVVARRLAVGPRDGTGTLAPGRRADAHTVRFGAPAEGQGCPVRSLPSLARELETARIDLLKLDVEGAEHDLVADPATRAFLRAAVANILVEVHPGRGGRSVRSFRAALGPGFELRSACGRVLGLRNAAIGATRA